MRNKVPMLRTWTPEGVESPVTGADWSASLMRFQDITISTVDNLRQPVSLNDLQDMPVEAYTGIKDINGDFVFEGDIIQSAVQYELGGFVTTEYKSKPFVVKKGNYAFGKFIARHIGTTGFDVRDYVFPSEFAIRGKLHDPHSAELVEDMRKEDLL